MKTVCLRLVVFATLLVEAPAVDVPRITLAPQDQKVAQNGIISFFCKASGNPAPDIHWRKGGERVSAIQTPRYMQLDTPHGSVLRIEPATAGRDNDTFECVADNGIGMPAVGPARLDIYAEDEALPSGYPRITKSPRLKAVQENHDTVMSCSAIGNPVPTIMWLKEFIPVDLTDPRLKLLQTGTLQIRHSQKSDEGKYECVAKNNNGVAYSYGANLYVRGVPPHFSHPPESVEIMQGSAVNITCIAVGSPTPYVKWRCNGRQLKPFDVRVGKNVLMLTNVQASANYTCVAHSNLGDIYAVAQVKVKAMPKPPTSVVISNVTATSIKLTWNAGSPNPIESYIIQYKRKYTPLASYDEIANVTNTEYTVIGLDAYTVYEFRVVAVNNIDDGIPSNPVNVTTGELAPGSPPREVRAWLISSSMVVVQWNEPEIPNDVIRGYKVYFTTTPDLHISLWMLHQVESTQMTTLTNLLANWTYTISVLAYTSVGDGPLSEPIQVLTQQGGVSMAQIMTIAPQNLVVLAGEQAHFLCQPSDGDLGDFVWSYTDGTNIVAMSSGKCIYTAYLNKIQLEANSTTRDYNLLINSTTRVDARQYSCDSRFPLMSAFTELIFLDREPNCTVSADVTNLLEGESFSVSCELSYSSKWDPQLVCRDVVNGETGQVDNTGTVPGSLLRASLPVTSISHTLHDHSFSCTIRFLAPPTNANIPDDTPTKKYSRTSPSYTFLFNTDRLYVQFPVRNLQIPGLQSVYYPGHRVSCDAEGRPTVRIRWVNVNTTETETSGRDLVITAAMEGAQEYRCEVENVIRGVTYTVNRTISFTVTTPTNLMAFCFIIPCVGLAAAVIIGSIYFKKKGQGRGDAVYKNMDG